MWLGQNENEACHFEQHTGFVEWYASDVPKNSDSFDGLYFNLIQAQQNFIMQYQFFFDHLLIQNFNTRKARISDFLSKGSFSFLFF